MSTVTPERSAVLQYPVEWTGDRVAILNVVGPAPNWSQQAASAARRVMSVSCKVTQGAGNT